MGNFLSFALSYGQLVASEDGKRRDGIFPGGIEGDMSSRICMWRGRIWSRF